MYMTSIFQAIYSPNDPRHWPTGSYLVLTALLALGFHYFYKDRKNYRPLPQALFLLIPYATLAIFLPQLTSIHPYTSDLLLVIPGTFLMSFWFLQKPFWRKFAGSTFVAWFIVASLILMTNLLNVAQLPRLVLVQRNLPFASLSSSFLGLRFSNWFRLAPPRS